MGLSSRLDDVSTDSIPILLVVVAASWVSYFRSLLLCVLQSIGFGDPRDDHAASAGGVSPLFGTIGSGLAGLIVLAEQLNCNQVFSYGEEVNGEGEGSRVESDCMVCLCGLREGEHVRRLSCCHVFHCECLDGWFDQMKLSCPLCRSPLVTEERRADAERRIGSELVAWLAPY